MLDRSRNLLRDSNNFSRNNWSTFDNSPIVFVNEGYHVEEWGATDAYEVRAGAGDATSLLKIYRQLTNATDTVVGKEYTMSFYVKNLRDDRAMGVTINGLDPRGVIEVGPLEAKRVSFTGPRTTNGLQLQFRAPTVGGYTHFAVWRAQVEEGTEVSPWSPAPEDNYADNYHKTTVTYAHAKLKIDDYWNRGITGRGVKIGIVDDGMGTHDALPISGGYACGRHETYMQENNHATHCAGIALARNLQNGQPTGIAPDAELYSIRMYYRTYADRVKSLIEAIDYAIETGLDILSMSIHIAENSINYDSSKGSSAGIPKHLRISFREAFFKAYKHGIIIVVAAGNNNVDGKDNIEFEELLPKMPNVIAVANLTPIDVRRSSSGIGRWVDVAGYGTYIRSTLPGNKYGEMTGTSMATPQIAGVFALYKQLFSDLTAQEVIEKVFDNCLPMSGLSNIEQGRGVPQPPSELYTLDVLITAKSNFRRYTGRTWQAVEAYAKVNNEWIETEAMGRG